MTVQDKATSVADGDQLDDGYFNDISGIISIEAGENVTAAKAGYVSPLDGKSYTGDTGNDADTRADGIFLTSVSSGADSILQTSGVFTTTGLTDKATYYLGAAGALSTTVSRIKLGVALSTTQLQIDIGPVLSSDWARVMRNAGNDLKGLVAHSPVKWSDVDSSGDISQSTDGGLSWTSKNTTMAGDCLLRVCQADKTLAFGCETTATNQDSAITSTSGDTWTDTTAGPAFGTAVYDVSFATAALIVIGGDDHVGTDHIVFGAVSSGQVTSWTNATTSPSLPVYAVNMWDANTGFAVDSGGNIWKTTNGAVDWTDTIHGVALRTPKDTIICISATSFIYVHESRISLYDGSGHPALKIYGQGRLVLGVVGLANGNVAALLSSRTAGDTGGDLFITIDGGVNWFTRRISARETVSDATTNKCLLTSDGNNNIIAGFTQNITKVYGGADSL